MERRCERSMEAEVTTGISKILSWLEEISVCMCVCVRVLNIANIQNSVNKFITEEVSNCISCLHERIVGTACFVCTN